MTRPRSQLDPAPPRLWHPDVPGPLWGGSRRVGRDQIEAYCRVLARESRPQKIIRFGSYAEGTATKESDVDLLVMVPFRGSDTRQVVRMRRQVEAPFPMDLLVWSPRPSSEAGLLHPGGPRPGKGHV